MAKSKKRVIRQDQDVEVIEPEIVHEPSEEVGEVHERSVLSRVAIAVLVLIGLFLIVNLISDRSDDDANNSSDDDTSQVEEKEEADDTNESDATAPEELPPGTSVEETDKEYKFVVGGGESYTTIARRAIASADSKLTHAERVAAETKLVDEAGAEWLNEGQSLVLSKETVTAAANWAKGLNDEQKAAWQPYADLVAW